MDGILHFIALSHKRKLLQGSLKANKNKTKQSTEPFPGLCHGQRDRERGCPRDIFSFHRVGQTHSETALQPRTRSTIHRKQLHESCDSFAELTQSKHMQFCLGPWEYSKPHSCTQVMWGGSKLWGNMTEFHAMRCTSPRQTFGFRNLALNPKQKRTNLRQKHTESSLQ